MEKNKMTIPLYLIASALFSCAASLEKSTIQSIIYNILSGSCFGMAMSYLIANILLGKFL
ncbi:MAG: hypothetical protein C5B43_00640 [Verrucomicrobia bacterium]|nr:MAG: hypothetical protein C5B43_00640 [Verrucomicrobiota bacterium]